MSIISVDFMSLYQQIERLKRLKYDIYEEIDRVEGIMHILDNMQIGDTVDELKNIIRELEDSADEIEIDIKNFKKYLEYTKIAKRYVKKRLMNFRLHYLETPHLSEVCCPVREMCRKAVYPENSTVIRSSMMTG